MNRASISITIFLMLSIPLFIVNCKDSSNNPKMEKKAEKPAMKKDAWIVPKVGLRYRDTPDLNGKKLGVIPYSEKVVLVEEKGNDMTISGVTGKWSRVEWNNKTGWVFGGFLSSTRPEISGNSYGPYGPYGPNR